MNANTYQQAKDRIRGTAGISAYDAVGDAMSISAGRISHFFNFEGPCFALDTACSGGLVALHLARQSLLKGECDSAIVAGINLILTPDFHIAFSKMGLLSPSGRCRSFDSNADGYVRSEGCIALVLRRESEALKRGDPILASIVGSAINHDGRTAALTAPNGAAQVRVMRSALDTIDTDPAQIRYVEAHGTGTPVGDPIEMHAIGEVYGLRRPGGRQLYVGSAKTNFGHIEAGAGLLGVAKAALSINRKVIFPSLHFVRPNPKIDLHDGAIQIPTSRVEWPEKDSPRWAAVNAFGYSGTNAHVLLREAPLAGASEARETRPFELLALSAKSSDSLAELAGKWEGFLSRAESGVLPDAAFSAATGRAELRHRLAVVGHSGEDLARSLRRWRDGGSHASVFQGQAHVSKGIAFVFTGQGSQYAGMGRQLYETEPVFAAAIDQCGELMVAAGLDVPLRKVLFEDRPADEINDTRYAQPALFAVEYALTILLNAWGIKPDIVIGHSIGELTAACVGGMLTLADAARFSVVRGRLMSELTRNGKMLALAVTEEVAQEWLVGREDAVAIAAVNGPRSLVVSGAAEAIDEIARLAEEAGVRATGLKVSHAFHSPLMDPVLTEIEKSADFCARRADMPIVSNLTGAPLSGQEGPQYWSNHARSTVRFYEGMRTLMATGCQTIIEVGPHPALSPLIGGAFGSTDARVIPTLRRDREDSRNMLTAAGALWSAGAPVTLAGLFADRGSRRVQIPLYPFRRTRYWVSGTESDPDGYAPRLRQGARHIQPLPGYETPDGGELPAYEARLSATSPWTDHRVLDMTVFPASGYLEMVSRAYAAARDAGGRPVVLSDVVFARPLVLKADQPASVLVALEDAPSVGSAGRGRLTFTVAAGSGERSTVHCRGLIEAADDAGAAIGTDTANGDRRTRLSDIRTTIPVNLAPGLLYGDLRRTGLEYSASFSTVRELRVGEAGQGEALGRVSTIPDGGAGESHPFRLSTLLDGSLHVVAAALGVLSSKIEDGVYIPASIQRLVLHRPFPVQVWSHAKVRTNDSGSAAVASVRITDENGTLLCVIENIELRHTTSIAAGGDVRQSGAPAQRQIRSRRKELNERLADLTHGERLAAITDWLSAEVRETLGSATVEIGLDGEDLDPSVALLEIGLDSLMITELQRRIQETLDFRFEAMEGLTYQSIDHLARYIHDRVLAPGPASTAVGV